MKVDEIKQALASYLKEASDQEVLEFVDKLVEERPKLKEPLLAALKEFRNI